MDNLLEKPKHARRIGIFGLIVFVVIISLYILEGLMGYGFGCGLGGEHLECLLIPSLLKVFLMFNVLFLLFLLPALIKPFFSSKKLNLLFGIYIICIALVFVIFSLFQGGGFVHKFISGKEFECSLYKEGTYEEVACYTELATINNDIEYCRKTQNAPDCYKYFAVKQGDPSLCSFGDDHCIIAVAAKTKDPSVCEKLENDYSSEQCFAGLARLTDNMSLCEKSSVWFVPCKDYLNSRTK